MVSLVNFLFYVFYQNEKERTYNQWKTDSRILEIAEKDFQVAFITVSHVLIKIC